MNHPTFPFVALVGQEDLKLGLILTVIDPALSGILIRGEKGTAKSTAVRALASLMPSRTEVGATSYHMSPNEYPSYAEALGLDPIENAEILESQVPVVELPVGATEDRVVGSLDMEKALSQGKKTFEPGLLAAAHRGILYVDEINLLDDHIIDVLLDSAAMGVNTVEREGISITHPARFCLVGTMNPEEGELRPQLLDRFGLVVTVEGSRDLDERITIMERRAAYDRDPEGFISQWQEQSDTFAAKIAQALDRLNTVEIPESSYREIAKTSIEAEVDGHRADLVMVRAARAHAAWSGKQQVTSADIQVAARFALPHRMRRQPLEGIGRWMP